MPDQTGDDATLSQETRRSESTDRWIAYRRFLLPIDFSDHSKRTTEYATRLAALTGASIHVMHVFQIPEYPGAFYHGLYLENETVKVHLETSKQEADVQLSLVADQIRANGLEAEAILRAGNPYHEIVNAAKEIPADLIVIGSHGYAGLGRLLLGGTADRVLQYAPCPVLVVKEPAVH
ncbi:MAG: universal stress protein [Acetobacteraceae bacterium]|nr:universal stress protein [Verrucomicrobiota bacterium]MBV8524445.1 universal stress protein [Acetobacteraceae bacterium]